MCSDLDFGARQESACGGRVGRQDGGRTVVEGTASGQVGSVDSHGGSVCGQRRIEDVGELRGLGSIISRATDRSFRGHLFHKV